MIILLYCFIVIANSSSGHCINVISIVHAIVIVVVTWRCNDQRNQINNFKSIQELKVSFFDKNIWHLCNISTMKIIMILNVFPVAFLYLTKELHHFVFIVQWVVEIKWEATDQTHYQVRQCVRSSYLGFKFKNVEIEVFYLFEGLIYLVFFHKGTKAMDFTRRLWANLGHPRHSIRIGLMWLNNPILKSLHIKRWVFLKPIRPYLETVSTPEGTISFIVWNF